MNNSTNALNWFEIPASNINRSKEFYETIFSIEMSINEMHNSIMAFFPWESGSGKATGAVVQSEMHVPSKEGSIIYLNANPNLDPVLERVEKAGGKVLVPKMNIGENGFIAFIEDTEGNKIGIHSQE